MKKPTRRLRATSDSGAARAETGRFATPEHDDTGEPTGVASALFERIALRLHEARARVVRAVNNEMVLTYWHIGRELVEHMQGGDDRAGYGDELIESLSARLTEAFGRASRPPTCGTSETFSPPTATGFQRFATSQVAILRPWSRRGPGPCSTISNGRAKSPGHRAASRLFSPGHTTARS